MNLKEKNQMIEKMLNRVEELNNNTPNGLIVDADTILVDLVQSEDLEFSGFAQDIFNIYRNSKDKEAVKQMFYEFTGTDFYTYLEKCEAEITRNELDAKLARQEKEEDMTLDKEEIYDENIEDEVDDLRTLSIEEKIERFNSLQESVGKRRNELHDLNLEVNAELINKVLRIVDESKKLEDILSDCHFNHWDTDDLHEILEQYSYHLNAIGQNDISHCYDVDVKLTKNAMVCFHKYSDDTVMQDLSSIGVFNDKGEHLGFFSYAELKQMEKVLKREEKVSDKREVLR